MSPGTLSCLAVSGPTTGKPSSSQTAWPRRVHGVLMFFTECFRKGHCNTNIFVPQMAFTECDFPFAPMDWGMLLGPARSQAEAWERRLHISCQLTLLGPNLQPGGALPGGPLRTQI